MSFLWGAATSAYQVEGANDACDWYDWERTPGSGVAEPAGSACEHVKRYADDIALLARLGFNCYRFSVEWSRIEPSQGRFHDGWLSHYRDMAACCRDHGLLPVVTLHHFTNPRWLARRGGWEDAATAVRFARFAAVTIEALGDQAAGVITINEPNIPALLGYENGVFPPGRRDRQARVRVGEVFIDAHRRAVDAIRDIRRGLPVGSSRRRPPLSAGHGRWQETNSTRGRSRAGAGAGAG